MYSSSKIQQATTLRSAGKSIDYIAKRLRVSKSTASIWVRNVSLTKEQKEKLQNVSKNAGKLAFKKTAQDRHQKHIQSLRFAQTEGKKRVGSLSKRDIHLVGLGLYWGEGYKKGSEELGFTNSDPAMIAFFLDWMKIFFLIKKENFILRVSINSTHKKREKTVLNFWSQKTGISLSQFTKTSFINTVQRKRYPNEKTHYGTLRVKVRKGAVIRAHILSAIDSLRS